MEKNIPKRGNDKSLNFWKKKKDVYMHELNIKRVMIKKTKKNSEETFETTQFPKKRGFVLESKR